MVTRKNNHPLAFGMHADVRMNRPITGSDVIGFGEATLAMNRRWMTFDFKESTGTVDHDSPDIVHLVCKDPDYRFEETGQITKEDLAAVNNVTDLVIHTNAEDLYPVELLSCSFILPQENMEEIHVPEEFCSHYRFPEEQWER